MESNNTEIRKGVDYYINALKEVGVYDQLRHFNDVIIENRPPHPDADYGEPVLQEVILDGVKSDIYHTDHSDDDSLHRLFIYKKA